MKASFTSIFLAGLAIHVSASETVLDRVRGAVNRAYCAGGLPCNVLFTDHTPEAPPTESAPSVLDRVRDLWTRAYCAGLPCSPMSDAQQQPLAEPGLHEDAWCGNLPCSVTGTTQTAMAENPSESTAEAARSKAVMCGGVPCDGKMAQHPHSAVVMCGGVPCDGKIAQHPHSEVVMCGGVPCDSKLAQANQDRTQPDATCNGVPCDPKRVAAPEPDATCNSLPCDPKRVMVGEAKVAREEL